MCTLLATLLSGYHMLRGPDACMLIFDIHHKTAATLSTTSSVKNSLVVAASMNKFCKLSPSIHPSIWQFRRSLCTEDGSQWANFVQFMGLWKLMFPSVHDQMKQHQNNVKKKQTALNALAEHVNEDYGIDWEN